MRFDWDPKKAASNELKHGLSFEEALTAFDDPYQIIKIDVRHSKEGELRKWLIGKTLSETTILMVFTEREEGKVLRLISARTAHRKERKLYEKFRNDESQRLASPITPGFEEISKSDRGKTGS